jgi:protease-4
MATESKRSGCLIVFVVVLLCLSLAINAGFLFNRFAGIASLGDELKFEEVLLNKPAGNAKTKIAVIRLKGIITNYLPGSVGDSMVEDLKIQLKQATEDKDVKAIVLAIDSPGGEVTASDMLYTAVKKAKAVKPVVISMGALAASGGYYIAIAGSHLMANETTYTGSIGVIMPSYNYEDFFKLVGLKDVSYKSGKMKDMMSGARTATPEEKEYINGMVQQTYSRFVGLVAKERQLSEDQLRAGPADGRVISGKDALNLKLIDAIGDFDDAVAKAQQLGGAPGAAVIGYGTSNSLGKYLKLLGKAEGQPKIEINLTPSHVLPLQPGNLYLLPSHLVP